MAGGIYINRVASAAGLTPQGIRYYENLGLLEKVHRTDSGYRTYPPSAVERVRFIKQAQQLGLSLQEIREVLRLKYSAQSPCACVRKMLKRKLASLRKQIAEMDKMRREIETCLRTSRNFSRLPHQASLVCPLIQNPVAQGGGRISKKRGQ